MNLPSVSIIIPTLNSAKVLGLCLSSILAQDYPKEKIEIIISDGGSTDGTLQLIKKHQNIRLVNNRLKTGEAGKAIGVKQAKNEIIALIDSDNILQEKDWLKRMVEPFQDPEIAASEPLYYTYRKTDPYIIRYCALLGMNDPLCLFLGNYDRYCVLTNKWTEVQNKSQDCGNYLKIELPDPNNLPTIGANGFLIRRKILEEYHIGDYLFDIDIIYDLVSGAKYKIAKVKIGIIHLYCSKVSQFIKKQKRRVKDYAYYSNIGLRKFPWNRVKQKKIVKFCISTIFIIPLLIQALKGIIKTRDSAFFFHPIACWFTLSVYGYNTLLRRMIEPSIESRDTW